MISVVVVDYNGGKVTQDCIDSIKSQDFKDYELLVIDNYPLKRTYSEGMIEGIRQSKGDIIICCSNDIVLLNKDFLTKAFEVMDADKQIGMAGPLVWDESIKRYATINKIGFLGYPYCVDEGTPDYINGACMIMRKRVLDRVGLFDTKFRIYYDDTDLALRIKKAGYKIHIIKGISIWHKGNTTIGSLQWFLRKRRHLHDILYFNWKKIRRCYV